MGILIVRIFLISLRILIRFISKRKAMVNIISKTATKLIKFNLRLIRIERRYRILKD